MTPTQLGALGMTDEHIHALRMSQMASCTCLTKTPDTKFHAADCRYRLLEEVIELLSASKPAAEPVAWILRAKNGMERGCYTRPVEPRDYEFAKIDGDTITPLYAAPQQPAQAGEADNTDYEALEREHFGDSDKRTGIYAPKSAVALDDEPVAWLHTMHMELEQTNSHVTFYDENPWGEPGKHYDSSYKVTSEPLFLAAHASGGAHE